MRAFCLSVPEEMAIWFGAGESGRARLTRPPALAGGGDALRLCSDMDKCGSAKRGYKAEYYCEEDWYPIGHFESLITHRTAMDVMRSTFTWY